MCLHKIFGSRSELQQLRGPGGLRIKAATMNRNIPGSHLAGDLCCMSFPTSLSPHLLSAVTNEGIKCPKI